MTQDFANMKTDKEKKVRKPREIMDERAPRKHKKDKKKNSADYKANEFQINMEFKDSDPESDDLEAGLKNIKGEIRTQNHFKSSVKKNKQKRVSDKPMKKLASDDEEQVFGSDSDASEQVFHEDENNSNVHKATTREKNKAYDPHGGDTREKKKVFNPMGDDEDSSQSYVESDKEENNVPNETNLRQGEDDSEENQF